MNNLISLNQAIQMTTLYRQQKDLVMNPDYAGREILPISETFDRAAFDQLLSQSGCVGLRVYYGMKDDLRLRAIIVGVNENNEDMLPATNETTAEDIIIEEGILCPPACPDPSPLNP